VNPAALSPEEEEVVAAKARPDRQQQRRKDMTPAERQAMQLKRNERNAAIQKQQDEIDALDNPPAFEEYSKTREFQLQQELLSLIKAKIGSSDKAKVQRFYTKLQS
jgi:hypothetical protein